MNKRIVINIEGEMPQTIEWFIKDLAERLAEMEDNYGVKISLKSLESFNEELKEKVSEILDEI